MWRGKLDRATVTLVVRPGDRVRLKGVVVTSEGGALLVSDLGQASAYYDRSGGSSGIALHDLPMSIPSGSYAEMRGLWMGDAVDVLEVTSSRQVRATAEGDFGVDLQPRLVASQRDILAVNRTRDGDVVVVVDNDSADRSSWARARVLVSGWSRTGLDQAVEQLAQLSELVALGQARTDEGDILLTVGLVRVTEEAEAILARLAAGLVDLHVLMTPD